MIRRHVEEVTNYVPGTIVFLLTIGRENRQFVDLTRYEEVYPVICGTLSGQVLSIHYVVDFDNMSDLLQQIRSTLLDLPKPYWTFDQEHVDGVLLEHLGLQLDIQGLQAYPGETMRDAMEELGIEQYEDPHGDNPRACTQDWLNGNFQRCVQHARASLLKMAELLQWRILPDSEAYQQVSDLQATLKDAILICEEIQQTILDGIAQKLKLISKLNRTDWKALTFGYSHIISEGG